MPNIVADSHEFSLYFKVNDRGELIRAARKRYRDETPTATEAEAVEMCPDDDVSAAVRMLLDPGDLPGCEIFDSACE